MLRRTEHFWEQRYYSRGFGTTDLMQGLAILRYIHNNPRAAGMHKNLCYGYGYSNPAREMHRLPRALLLIGRLVKQFQLHEYATRFNSFRSIDLKHGYGGATDWCYSV